MRFKTIHQLQSLLAEINWCPGWATIDNQDIARRNADIFAQILDISYRYPDLIQPAAGFEVLAVAAKAIVNNQPVSLGSIDLAADRFEWALHSMPLDSDRIFHS